MPGDPALGLMLETVGGFGGGGSAWPLLLVPVVPPPVVPAGSWPLPVCLASNYFRVLPGYSWVAMAPDHG